jgi:DNA adenine methylase
MQPEIDRQVLRMSRIDAVPIVYQSSLFGETSDLERVVNVASVAQLSPFRYPGGKTWLVPRVIRWLNSRSRVTEFVEPFAGGAIVSLSVADQQLAEHVTMVEKDTHVAAVWKAILEGDAGWLVQEILAFDVTYDNVIARLNEPGTTLRERAFQTILKNRTYHGGILAAGSAPIKFGENGRGIRSRWYPETLQKRIMKVASLADRITFVEGDGMEVMASLSGQEDAVFFIDPPYTAAGKRAGSRLYTHSELDHDRLFQLTSRVSGDVLMTYDDAQGVRDLAAKYGLDTKTVAMKNTHHAEMKELLIGRDLSWCEV